MSKQFLKILNGSNNGAFRRWLETCSDEPRIAWYPSAGMDFRDMLYLRTDYARWFQHGMTEYAQPDLFVHTDYMPRITDEVLAGKILHDSPTTRITILDYEDLPPLDLPLHKGIAQFREYHPDRGRVLFMNVAVQSCVLGEYTVPLVYAIVENIAFCAEKVLPNGGHFSHVLRVRHGGGGCCGGSATGVWMENILDALRCEIYICDNRQYRDYGDRQAVKLYPILAGKKYPRLITMQSIKGKYWSGYSDSVLWRLNRNYPQPQKIVA